MPLAVTLVFILDIGRDSTDFKFGWQRKAQPKMSVVPDINLFIKDVLNPFMSWHAP